MPRSLIPVITPHGSLRLDQADDDFVPESGLADRLEKSFEWGSAHGLLHLGTSEAGSVLPASLAWWRDFGMRFIADLCALGDAKGPAGRTELAAPTSSELAALIVPLRGVIPEERHQAVPESLQHMPDKADHGLRLFIEVGVYQVHQSSASSFEAMPVEPTRSQNVTVSGAFNCPI
jgi:hypothetical protein